jgi:DNA mismatch repair ATPase MutS
MNQGFAIFARLLLWSTHFSLAIERWRLRSGSHIGQWLAAIAEMEALGSLAGYAAEHSGDTYPELVDDGLVFHAQALAHPLLAPGVGVPNDVSLDGELRLLLVSGSNMSGKSTLLRSVGLNTVLAWAGAPVRAQRLRISRLSVGASIRVNDSLQDGKSRFYAEITRLRQIVEMAGGETPLLFLLDELLSGTNSHDRLIGAHAVVKTLVRLGAAGLVTTHDLALADMVEELAPHARNVHFEDHLENGRIAFDYKLREGVVRKSNAIELMRSVGLPV